MKVLLIDNGEQSLSTLNTLLKQRRCKTAYIADAIMGIKLLQKHAFDVVIIADKPIRTTLSNLLKAIALKFPQVVRFAVVGEDKTNEDLSTHYVYRYPIDAAQISKTITALGSAHHQITKAVVVKSVSQVKTLPSPPKVYLQLNRLLKQANVDSNKIAEIVSQDPALAAKVIQFTNNTFAQSDKPITSISEAITKMGVDTLSCIVMTAELFSYQPDIPNYSILDEQLKALNTAKLAASLVPVALKQDALLAGLLHSIGKLVLFEMDKKLTLTFFNHHAKMTDDIALEKRIFSTDHCQVGAYLLHIWGFPYSLIEAVLYQYSPEKLLGNSFGISQATYLANTLLNKKEIDQTFVTHYQLEPQLEKLQSNAAKFM
ncbi:HDOD domain-containing protein [Thalassotalea sp. 1_MG-2023]|uniref:HDOD domain-containing protein n=1 Tax=Thalassotalea sp. 1_MG-2023 TaxID=3062680 RepID=UPI0026E2380E|nr:HDOD domain-containing protein [Thalassotalea sp. 1_MG-2023]MDO6428500.1 HDOD domain-containing protein [Thalassotalea sp. 1_MG-2023]